MSASSSAPALIDPGWHLQILHTEWVLWGYGPRPGGSHVERAITVITIPVGGRAPIVIKLPFELPEARAGSSLPPPEEHERRHAVGWRFRQNELRQRGDWHLAATEEEAIAGARAWVEKQAQRDRFVFAWALEADIRRG